jgi:hypothetical protein
MVCQRSDEGATVLARPAYLVVRVEDEVIEGIALEDDIAEVGDQELPCEDILLSITREARAGAPQILRA